jgi:type VI secretion system FHA domain protein
MPVTLRFQSTGTMPGDASPAVLRGPSLSIGRGAENDVVLPDPDRTISKRHCVIEDRAGSIYVIDLSSNGTFLNYGRTALGPTPAPLNDGDILTMGPYEMLVEIPATAATARDPVSALPPPVQDGPVSSGRAGRSDELMSLLDDPSASGFLDDLLGGPALPGGPGRVLRPDLADDGLLPPLGGELLTPSPNPSQGASIAAHSPAAQDHFRPPTPVASVIPDDWDDLLSGISPSEGPDQRQADVAIPDLQDPFSFRATTDDLSRPAFIPESDDDPGPPVAAPAPLPRDLPPAVTVAVAVVVPPPATATATAAGDAAARAFLSAMGAGGSNVTDAELGPTLSRLGHVLRMMIHGVREVLMTRTSIKSEFRISQTMIGAGGNNPLKFSISPEQAIEAMVKPTTPGYLDAAEATQQALRDIKAHEIAMMTGMEAALKGVLARLSPSALEGKIETNGGIGSILKGKKARYWEVYEKMYEEISDQAENDFHELFSKEFARAYQDQLERLK